MCGIAGILGGPPVDPAVVERMGRALRHRGPDQYDQFAAEGVGIACARLAILDLSDAGDQPFTDDLGALAFNGEIYNHRRLGHWLEDRGVVFKGRSDTEVLFRHLQEVGIEDTLPALRGMFAFAYVDRRRGRAWLARDRLGIKPLLWAASDLGVVWASEAKALAPVVDLRPDPVRTIFATLGQGDRSPDATVFQGVEQVAPGAYVEVDDGRVVIRRQWWDLVEQVDESLYRELDRSNPGVTSEAVLGLVNDAVESMLVSDPPTGTFLSGGVDSSLVACLAAERTGADHVFFCADVGGARSEVPAAQAVAETIGRPLEVAPFPADALLDDWAAATWHYEAPIVSHVNALPFSRVAGAAAGHGTKAVLSGEGADELFYGYTELASARHRHALRAPLRALDRVYRLMPGLSETVLPELRPNQAEFLLDVASQHHRQRLLDRGREAFGFLPDQAAERHGLVLPMLSEHLLTLLHRNDRMAMQRSVEARFPYLDEEVLRFGINLPLRFKLARTPRIHDRKHPFLMDKAVVRRAALHRLPAPVARRPKRGFPLYGHDHLKVEPGFWRDGYLEAAFGLVPEVATHLDRSTPPYHVAKLASVEVFGRIFGLGHDVDRVTGHIRDHARLTGDVPPGAALHAFVL